MDLSEIIAIAISVSAIAAVLMMVIRVDMLGSGYEKRLNKHGKNIQELINDQGAEERLNKIRADSRERYERRVDVLTVHLTTIAWRELNATYGPQGIRLGIMNNMRSDSYSIVFYNRQNVGIDVVTAPNELDLIDTLHNKIAAYLMIEQSIKESDIPAEDPYDV